MSKVSDDMVTIEEYARLVGESPESIGDMIRSGSCVGERIDGVWYVALKEHQKSSVSTTGHALQRTDVDSKMRMVVTDIQMPFWSMVLFMVKFCIASIPALLILTMIFALTKRVFTGFFSMISG